MGGKILPKLFLILVNIVFFLAGACLVILGILVKIDVETLLGTTFDSLPIIAAITDLTSKASSYVDDKMDSDLVALLESGGYVLITMGILMFVLGMLGLCGACKDSRCCLVMYGFAVLAILSIEFAVCVFVGLNSEKIENDITTILDESLIDYEGFSMDDEGDGFKVADDVVSFGWDTIQISLECCGVWNYSVFTDHSKWRTPYQDYVTENSSGVVIPASCCNTISLDYFPDEMDKIDMNETVACMLDPSTDVAHEEGCYSRVRDMLKEYSLAILGVIVLIMVVEIVGIVCACLLTQKDD